MSVEVEWPDVPEEYFWRVREDKFYVDSLLHKTQVPGVFLVKVVNTKEKPEPVSRFDDELQVGGSEGAWEVEVKSQYISTVRAFGRPAEEVNSKTLSQTARSVWTSYSYELDRDKREAEAERKRQEVRDTYYGDYRRTP